MRTNSCIDCGRPIKPTNKRCASCNYKNPERNMKLSIRQLGNKNHCWKGGRTTTSDGYIKIKMIGHCLADKRGYVLEHRLIASKKYNLILKPTDIVHHLNGVRSDNRFENLVITDKKGNGEKTFIKCLQNRIKELESKLSRL